MISISKVKINRKEEISSLSTYDGKNVSQVLGYLPSDIILAQSCYIFFRSIQYLNRMRVRSPEMFFLMLLTSSPQIKDAISSSKINIPGENYLIKCNSCRLSCDQDGVSPLTREDRIRLTLNAITFA
ncbi:hypothetical protein [Sulfuracidifex tepidarius]|nr:hypothetical protein [Sulfuracidifex tepidarius]BBG24459.1 hypothetical protein IC006_1778 [Sulfuracidifex tepidarius]